MDNKELEKQQIQNFISLIKNIVRITVQEEFLNVERYYDGYTDGAAETEGSTNVILYTRVGDRIKGSKQIKLSDVPNRTGGHINSDTKVRVYAASPTLKDAYIGRIL